MKCDTTWLVKMQKDENKKHLAKVLSVHSNRGTSPTATSPKRREVLRNLALSLWAAGHKSPDLTIGDNDLRVRSPRGGSPALPRVHMDEVLRAGFHGSGLPRTGPEPPWAGPGTPHVEAGPPGGLSLRASQGARTPLPAREGVRSRHVPL